MSKIFLALAFASMAQAVLVEKDSQLEKTQEQHKLEEHKKLEIKDQEARSVQTMGMTAAAKAMELEAMHALQQYVVADQEKEIAKKATREKRWASILHKQKESLVQHEQALKAEEKDLLKIKREKEWQQQEAAKEQKTEVSSCAGQKSAVRAFISSSDSHMSCLKSQLGACVATEATAALSLKCDEPSAGWQKKCLADKAQEMIDCAPLGVDWSAMRQGEKGIAADNAALQRLGEWCTLHRALGKIQQSKATAPFSLILSKDAALSKDAVQKLGEFGENFHQQEWDFLQVDPIGEPAKLHSVLVKSDSAEKLQKAMSEMKAVPLENMPKAVNAAGSAKAVSWTAGVSGMLERESSDCSLQSPHLLKPKEDGKLSAALR